MSAQIYAVEGDQDKVIGVTLLNDGNPVNLTGESITCNMLNNVTGAVRTITGLTGDASGNVATPFAASDLIVGNWLLEWEITDGLTYPGKGASRPVLTVRTEHA